MGKQDGCLQPEGKEVQAWDSVGQPAVEMTRVSVKAERLNRTKGYVFLAKAVAFTTKAWQEKLSFEALDFVLSLPPSLGGREVS